MSREQLSEHESQGAAPAQAEQEGDIQGLPPNLYHQAARIRPGDVQGLRDLLTLFPDFAQPILAVASHHAGLSTVKQAQAMVQQNVTGQRGSLTSQQIHPGGEFAVEGSAPVLGPEPAPQAEAAPLPAVSDAKPLSKPEQRQILHDPSDPKPLSKPEQREILHDPSDPKALNKPELAKILRDPTDPYQQTPELLTPTQVEDASAYNAAHPSLVAAFNTLTHDVYRARSKDAEMGALDPQKVAAWQADRNLQVDGKVGPHTLAAAKAASKNHTEIVAEGQVDPQPPQPTGIPV
jgi:hypothetical protein